MKQRRILRRSDKQQQRFSLGDFVMPSHNLPDRRTIVVKLKFFDSTTAVAAVLPVVQELLQQLESLQQQQRLREFEPIVEIHSSLSFRGSQQALALVTQAIDNSAARLEELRSTGQIAHFELSYQLHT